VLVNLVVVVDPSIVTLDRTDEDFGHSIALRTFDWRSSRIEADVASEAAVSPAR
jgi:hypothetical protein